jgi:hypothetical protein
VILYCRGRFTQRRLIIPEVEEDIARVTTSGVFTEYEVPTAFGNPPGIAVGPDANIWFTEGLGNKMGALRPSATSPTALG